MGLARSSGLTTGPAPGDVGVDLRRQWILAFVVGELIGFIPPAVTGVVLVTQGATDVVLVVGLTMAGVLEGAAIGLTQAYVLARFAPEVDGRRWLIATSAAAGFAWFVGMGGSALIGTNAAPPAVLGALLLPAAGAALLAMGYAQWRVLRDVVVDARRWIWVTACAWLIGVAIPVVALSVVPNTWPGWAHAATGVIAAVAMGYVVGALTGRTLSRLLGQLDSAGRTR